MIPKSRDEAEIALKVCAQALGDRFDITACALACAIHENPDRPFGQALDLLAEITSRTRALRPQSPYEFGMLLYGEFGFANTFGQYDDPANADLVHTLENRGGLPIALGHIWRHAARSIDAPLHGTDTPGHFIMRLETTNGPVFLDPFEGGSIVDDTGLADMARRAGLDALTPRMLNPVSDRVMAVRLQTNLVARAKSRGDVEAWARAAKRRAILAPANYEVALDYSQAAEAAGQLKVALEWSQIASHLPGAPNLDKADKLDQRSQSLNLKLN